MTTKTSLLFHVVRIHRFARPSTCGWMLFCNTTHRCQCQKLVCTTTIFGCRYTPNHSDAKFLFQLVQIFVNDYFQIVNVFFYWMTDDTLSVFCPAGGELQQFYATLNTNFNPFFFKLQIIEFPPANISSTCVRVFRINLQLVCVMVTYSTIITIFTNHTIIAIIVIDCQERFTK